ncbi:hypothetical protein OG625_38450 [Streptomyces sp. NBC_01351]|uniref:hypothetical protein n=1 Tax=Streptomyces sp. NBC_01351 TaxID=2903833 RepID=UPI002E32A935|nr:hypothetical protein [Streptomyces sp. NBC_01351]
MEHSSEREKGTDAVPDPAEGQAAPRDIRAGHLGLGVTVIALIVIASFSGPRWTLIVSGAFAAWFILALAVIHMRGGRSWDALRRAYNLTFGWGEYVSP